MHFHIYAYVILLSPPIYASCIVAIDFRLYCAVKDVIFIDPEIQTVPSFQWIAVSKRNKAL